MEREVISATDTYRSADRSAGIGKIAAALAKAQAQIEGATKGAVNPHFLSKYADLASVWEACRVALTANEIAVVQMPSAAGPQVTVTTMLLHSSGEWMQSSLTMHAADAKPQAIGSAITYGRRYGLASMVGVAPEDDDGNTAQGHDAPPKTAAASLKKPVGYDDWRANLEASADNGKDSLKETWKGGTPAYRTYMDAMEPGKLDTLKAKAEKVAA